MTIKELIDKLKKFPPDMRVVTRGYQDGYENPISVDKISIHLDANKPGHYNGNHEYHRTDDREECFNCGVFTKQENVEEVISISED